MSACQINAAFKNAQDSSLSQVCFPHDSCIFSLVELTNWIRVMCLRKCKRSKTKGIFKIKNKFEDLCIYSILTRLALKIV